MQGSEQSLDVKLAHVIICLSPSLPFHITHSYVTNKTNKSKLECTSDSIITRHVTMCIRTRTTGCTDAGGSFRPPRRGEARRAERPPCWGRRPGPAAWRPEADAVRARGPAGPAPPLPPLAPRSASAVQPRVTNTEPHRPYPGSDVFGELVARVPKPVM